MNQDIKLWEEVQWLFELTQKNEDMPAIALVAKLAEEVGEFAESVLKDEGYLQHKELKEGPIHEAADVINVVIGILAQLYPGRNPRYLTEELYVALCEKGEKYERVLKQNGR